MLSFVIGIVVGIILRVVYVNWVAYNIIKKTKPISDVPIRKVRVEKHENIFFVYNEHGEFLAQGSTLKEIDDLLSSSSPGMKNMITPENAREIGML